MKINDIIYGEEEIQEQVLIDLINSKAVQRLKKISQQGLPQNYWPKQVFSRYEHSLGVLILLRRMGAELNEQITGLLHDVSHMAFSHVADFVFGDPVKDDFQDKNHLNFIESSDIPKILGKYNLDYKDFASLQKYTLLEQEIPHLCADRFDYAIREIFNEEGKEKKNFLLDHLTSIEGRMAFTSYDSAITFALGFLKCQVYHWGSKDGKTRHRILAEILIYSLKKNIISIEDMWKNDEQVIFLLKNSNDNYVNSRLGLLEKNHLDEEELVEDIPKKFRYVDPIIVEGEKSFVLSEVSGDYKKLLDIEKEKSMKINFSSNHM